MTQEEKEEFRKKLMDSIAETEANIEELKDQTKPIAPEDSLGRITRMDAINNKSVAEASLRIARGRLAKMRMALEKLDESDFGNCTICGNPIQAKRLMFMPQSTSCVRCAARR